MQAVKWPVPGHPAGKLQKWGWIYNGSSHWAVFVCMLWSARCPPKASWSLARPVPSIRFHLLDLSIFDKHWKIMPLEFSLNLADNSPVPWATPVSLPELSVYGDKFPLKGTWARLLQVRWEVQVTFSLWEQLLELMLKCPHTWPWSSFPPGTCHIPRLSLSWKRPTEWIFVPITFPLGVQGQYIVHLGKDLG